MNKQASEINLRCELCVDLINVGTGHESHQSQARMKIYLATYIRSIYYINPIIIFPGYI